MSRPVAGHRRSSWGETRDPRGATRSGTYAYDNVSRLSKPKWDAEHAITQGYMASWLVNRGINILADRISSLPFRAGADLEKPDEYNVNAPLAKLLGPPPGNPNAELSARAMWKLAIKSYLVTGRFAWEIDSAAPVDGGVELWPLQVQYLSTVTTNGGRRYFDGFSYHVHGDFEPVPFKREDVVYAWNPSLSNPREPESPLQALALNVSIIVELDTFHYAFIKNDAKPATVVVHGQFETEAHKRAWISQFMGNHQGARNANKTAFVEVDPDDEGEVGGMLDIKTIGATNRDSQITEIYEQQLQAVSGGLGIPMSLLDASGRTFDNAGQEDINFHELTLMPLCADLQDHINRDLAPKLGTEIGWFDFGNVRALRPRLSEGVAFSDVKDDLLRDERRGFVGLEPVDEAALLAEKEQNIALAQAAQTPMGEDPAANAEKADDKKDGPPQPKGAPGTKPTDDTPAVKKKTRAEEMSEQVHRVRDTAIRSICGSLDRQLRLLNEHSERSLLTRAEGKRGRQMVEKREDIDAIFERGFWVDTARTGLAPVYEAAAAAAGAALAGFVDDEDLTGWVDRRASALAERVTDQRAAALTIGEERPGDTEALASHIRAAHAAPTSPDDLMTLATFAFDDAVRQISGVPRDTVRSLLTKMVLGDIDLDRALEEIS